MMRDFNLNLQNITKYLEPIGFKRVIRSGIAICSLGNQINQVFCNQPIIFSKCEDAPFPTDLLVISATLSIKSSIDNLLQIKHDKTNSNIK